MALRFRLTERSNDESGRFSQHQANGQREAESRSVADTRLSDRSALSEWGKHLMNDTVLFLCCCSNRKLAGGERAYQPTNSMPLSVPEQRCSLLRARQSVFQGIRDGAKSVQGTPLRDLPYNAQPPLAPGPDLGGQEAARYMPAMERYRGRFYQELDPEESGVLVESTHHWLIASTLYGLLTPEEPIQRYSCHTLDDPKLTEIWTKSDLITSLLLGYVRVFDVALIVDLMADATYRDLFNWERVSQHAKVLRAFGSQNAGPGLLPALGFLVRDRLLQVPAEKLMNIKEQQTYITDYEDVVLTPCSAPPPPFLEELSPLEELAPLDDEGPSSPVLPQPPLEPGEECIVLARPREVRVTSGGHGTILGYPITHIRDFPPGARRLFDQVSRAAEVLDIRLGPFSSSGGRRIFSLDVLAPGRRGDGFIEGRLKGPGRIGGSQRFQIRVTPGREWSTYLALVGLIRG